MSIFTALAFTPLSLIYDHVFSFFRRIIYRWEQLNNNLFIVFVFFALHKIHCQVVMKLLAAMSAEFLSSCTHTAPTTSTIRVRQLVYCPRGKNPRPRSQRSNDLLVAANLEIWWKLKTTQTNIFVTQSFSCLDFGDSTVGGLLVKESK